LQIARLLEGEIASALADGSRGERMREGLVVAIAGPPNAGKSTLLNRIAKREAAIVSPYAGTTRDVIEVHLDLGGLPVTLVDTAGIRETSDPVELEGVRRAQARAGSADLVLWVVDAGGSLAERSRPKAEGSQGAPPAWLVRNKIDLIQSDKFRNERGDQSNRNNEPSLRTNNTLRNVVNQKLMDKSELEFNWNELEFDISAVTGSGLAQLLAQLTHYTEHFLSGAESALLTRERHRRSLEDVLAALRRALGNRLAGQEDLLAEELRIAARALGRLTGRVDVEDILDVIFRDFCIGK
jgi:tRNA modification GTPase